MSEKPFRVLPKLTDQNEGFWTGGAEGKLHLLHCQHCSHIVHPPTPFCPACQRKDLAFEPVSGRATVLTYTLNHQPWVPAPDHPYVIAIVEIEEQEGVRLMTNIVGCSPEDVTIGMAVEVVFEQHEDVYVPLFQPAAR